MNVPYSCDALRDYYLRSRDRELRVRIDPENMAAAAVKIGASWIFARPLINGLDGVRIVDWRNGAAEVRQKYQAQSALNLSTIMESVLRLKKFATNAQKLAHVMPNTITAADIARAESELFLGISDGPKDAGGASLSGREPTEESFPTGSLDERRFPADPADGPGASPRAGPLRVTKIERGRK